MNKETMLNDMFTNPKLTEETRWLWVLADAISRMYARLPAFYLDAKFKRNGSYVEFEYAEGTTKGSLVASTDHDVLDLIVFWFNNMGTIVSLIDTMQDGIIDHAYNLASTLPETAVSLLALVNIADNVAKDIVRNWAAENNIEVLFKGQEAVLLVDVVREDVYEECDFDCDEVLYENGMTVRVEETMVFNFMETDLTELDIPCTDGDTLHSFQYSDLEF